MQRSVECPVCTELYNTTTKIPKSVSCGHGFCAPCLDTLLSGTTISCPKCRSTCDVPGGQVAKLPTNFSVIDILEALCEECRDRPHTERCDHCSQNLCDICKISHPDITGNDDSAEFLSLIKFVADLTDRYIDNKEAGRISARGEKIIEEISEARQELHYKVDKRYDKLVSEVKSSMYQYTLCHLEWQSELETLLSKAKLFINKMKLIRKTDSTAIVREGALDEIVQQSNDHQTVLRSCVMQEPKAQSVVFRKYRTEQFDAVLEDAAEIVHVQSPNYKGASQTNTSRCDMGKPLCICEDPRTDNIFVTDWDNEILVFDNILERLHKFDGHATFNGPFGVTISKDRKVYIADCRNHQIKVADVDGTILFAFGKEGTGDQMYNCPAGLAFDSQDLLYVSDSGNHRVKVTDKYGKFILEFGQSVFVLEKPRHISVSPSDEIAVTDNRGNLYMFSKNGNHLRTFEAEEEPHHVDYTGVTFDEHGHIVATDHKHGRLVVMKTDGNIVCIIGERSLSCPEGLAVTKGGNIIVCDGGNTRIQKITVPFVPV